MNSVLTVNVNLEDVKKLKEHFGILVQVAYNSYEAKMFSMKDTKTVVDSIESIDLFFKNLLDL